jgi:hypothetical protein
MAQVHRYGNRVAGHLYQGPTTYMSPTEARLFGEALIAAADNVEAQPKFASSTFRTVNVELTDPENKDC